MECRNFLRNEKYDHLDERCKQRSKIKLSKKPTLLKESKLNESFQRVNSEEEVID